MAPHILCFSHCDKQVFSAGKLPHECPSCHTDLISCHLNIPPFSVPSPFKRAVDFPTSIVIKPTKGWLKCYKRYTLNSIPRQFPC